MRGKDNQKAAYPLSPSWAQIVNQLFWLTDTDRLRETAAYLERRWRHRRIERLEARLSEPGLSESEREQLGELITEFENQLKELA